MAFFKKNSQPDKGAEYRKSLLQSLAVQENISAKWAEEEEQMADLELDLENELEKTMTDNGMEKQTIPNSLIDEHLRKIKDLASQADDHEAEGKRRLTLAKEARLGIAALEAANRVLQEGQAPAESPVSLRGTTTVDGKTTSFNLPAATGLSEAGK